MELLMELQFQKNKIPKTPIKSPIEHSKSRLGSFGYDSSSLAIHEGLPYHSLNNRVHKSPIVNFGYLLSIEAKLYIYVSK